ncbi:ABC transporter ATP-binding protein [Peribacillus alkalitolerans]|uniref:ABC transporter ATP-binding protein n=1 Tax=Peribacillus alkalitolerans TaxID=1550385 RepID=UPI0013D150FD|nr:ABC transporter ATP-binding protein [Peribacillus alkalitolerans]
MSSSFINMSNVSKSYGKHAILSNITLGVERGEIFGLLGPSGAGKTTLVKMLVNLEKATSGEIFIGPEKLPSQRLIHQIGYMAQSDALYPELTAYENMDFFSSLFGLKGKEKKRRIEEVLEIVNLQEHQKKSVSAFSGGMKRRLSLAASLIHKPALLILDEPTVGIDPVLRQSIWQQFHNLKEEGTTIIVTTHVMDEAEKCDRLGLLRDGNLIALGSPNELKQQANASSIEEAFLRFGGAVHAN